MARQSAISVHRPWRLQAIACSIAVLFAQVTVAEPLDDFLGAADRGECIETVAYRLIKDVGSGEASNIVRAALRAQSMRSYQQRELGCAGDIAAQAIVAGADPDQVLQATAAGL